MAAISSPFRRSGCFGEWVRWLVPSNTQPVFRSSVIAISSLALLVSACATRPTAPSAASSETALDPQSNYIVEAQVRGAPRSAQGRSRRSILRPAERQGCQRAEACRNEGGDIGRGPAAVEGEHQVREIHYRRRDQVTAGDVVERTAPCRGRWNHQSGQHARRSSSHRTCAPRSPGAQIRLPRRFDRQRGLYYEFDYGQLILTRFTLADSLTTATGAAASVIAKRRSGIWDGGPFVHPVRFGVSRPVRRMVLGKTPLGERPAQRFWWFAGRSRIVPAAGQGDPCPRTMMMASSSRASTIAVTVRPTFG